MHQASWRKNKIVVGCKNCYPRSESWTRLETLRFCYDACKWSWDCCASDRSWFEIWLRDRRSSTECSSVGRAIDCSALYYIRYCRKSIGRWFDSGHSEKSVANVTIYLRATLQLCCVIIALACVESRKAMRMDFCTQRRWAASFPIAIERPVYISRSLLSVPRSFFGKIVSLTVN